MIKTYDLTKEESFSLTRSQLQELILAAVAAALAEQIEYFKESHPNRTQTANRETQTALLQMEAAQNVKH